MWDHTQTSLHSIFDYVDWRAFDSFMRTLIKLDLAEPARVIDGVGPGVRS